MSKQYQYLLNCKDVIPVKKGTLQYVFGSIEAFSVGKGLSDRMYDAEYYHDLLLETGLTAEEIEQAVERLKREEGPLPGPLPEGEGEG